MLVITKCVLGPGPFWLAHIWLSKPFISENACSQNLLSTRHAEEQLFGHLTVQTDRSNCQSGLSIYNPHWSLQSRYNPHLTGRETMALNLPKVSRINGRDRTRSRIRSPELIHLTTGYQLTSKTNLMLRTNKGANTVIVNVQGGHLVTGATLMHALTTGYRLGADLRAQSNPGGCRKWYWGAVVLFACFFCVCTGTCWW